MMLDEIVRIAADVGQLQIEKETYRRALIRITTDPLPDDSHRRLEHIELIARTALRTHGEHGNGETLSDTPMGGGAYSGTDVS